MTTQIDKLERIHPDLIASFLATGNSSGIPEDVQIFLKQISLAGEIYDKEKNVSRAARKLKVRIATELHMVIDIQTCIARIYSALEFFHMDCTVATEIWENHYSDRYEDLAKFALANNDVKTAKKCTDASLECKRRASAAVQINRQWAPVFLISPDITPEKLGYKKRSLYEISRKSNAGEYLKIIDSLPIEADEKKRLLKDADIEEIDDAEIISDNDS